MGYKVEKGKRLSALKRIHTSTLIRGAADIYMYVCVCVCKGGLLEEEIYR